MNLDVQTQLLSRVLGTPLNPRTIHARLSAIGGLRGLIAAGAEALGPEVDEPTQDKLEAVLELSEALYAPDPLEVPITSAEDVAERLGPRVSHHPTETSWVLSLDARLRLIGIEHVATGTLNACLVHPREVFAPAIRARAAHIIFVHNHPSGDPTPSPEDHTLNTRLSEAGMLLGIPLIDHVILARTGHSSLGPG